MLSADATREVAEIVRSTEERLTQMMTDRRVRQEPDMTSRLATEIELRAETVDGVTVELTVVDGIGPGSAERRLGADLIGVVRLEVGGLRLTKGFLAQSKRSGSDGLFFAPPDDIATGDFSHWLYRGPLQLRPSGTVELSKPSPRLDEQCDNMLKRTPASFVFVFDDSQVAVVGASAVHAHRNRPARTKRRLPLGTKTLDDFFVHLIDSFIGDTSIVAADVESLPALASTYQASAGLLLRISDQ
jgi:hypothetical protein